MARADFQAPIFLGTIGLPKRSISQARITKPIFRSDNEAAAWFQDATLETAAAPPAEVPKRTLLGVGT